MKTVEATRRARLQVLVDREGSMANLCERIGLARNDTAALTRVLNGNIRRERGGKLYEMGSASARSLEAKLGLPEGWMDTPIAETTPTEITGEANSRATNPLTAAMAIEVLAQLLVEADELTRAQIAPLLQALASDPGRGAEIGGRVHDALASQARHHAAQRKKAA
jgi:hypothetical protein